MSLRQLIFKFPSIQTTARGNVSLRRTFMMGCPAR
jgi:hypothetical protein